MFKKDDNIDVKDDTTAKWIRKYRIYRRYFVCACVCACVRVCVCVNGKSIRKIRKSIFILINKSRAVVQMLMRSKNNVIALKRGDEAYSKKWKSKKKNKKK